MPNDLDQVISVLMSIISGGSGGAVAVPFIFGAIELLNGFFKMSGDVKRGLALAFSLLTPSAAYGLLLLLTHSEFSPITLLVACATGGYLAVKAHDEIEQRGWEQGAVRPQEPVADSQQ